MVINKDTIQVISIPRISVTGEPVTLRFHCYSTNEWYRFDVSGPDEDDDDDYQYYRFRIDMSDVKPGEYVWSLWSDKAECSRMCHGVCRVLDNEHTQRHQRKTESYLAVREQQKLTKFYE